MVIPKYTIPKTLTFKLFLENMFLKLACKIIRRSLKRLISNFANIFNACILQDHTPRILRKNGELTK